MGALVDSRRTRTAAGALLELSAMANEKLLLHKELDRWKVRHVEIQKRLAEITVKEHRLMEMVQAAPGGWMPGTPAGATATAASAVVMPEARPDQPIEAPPGRRVKVKEFSY